VAFEGCAVALRQEAARGLPEQNHAGLGMAEARRIIELGKTLSGYDLMKQTRLALDRQREDMAALFERAGAACDRCATHLDEARMRRWGAEYQRAIRRGRR
jgi:hypothetical protein